MAAIQCEPSTPASLGQKTKAESLPVTFPSDGGLTVDTTGLATDANQTTIIGHIDGLETDLAAVKTATARIPGDLLSGISFDYYTVDRSGATTNVWTYKTGGSGGTLVATITVTYTDATKTLISSAAKT